MLLSAESRYSGDSSSESFGGGARRSVDSASFVSAVWASALSIMTDANQQISALMAVSQIKRHVRF
jgi:hypothetical protein